MSEEWRPIPLAPGYEASDQGRVRSFRRGAPDGGRLLALVPKSRTLNYRVVRIRYADKWQVRLVHQLVLEAFVGPRPESATDVRHLNDIKDDNRLVNLAWGTPAENMQDRVRNGTHHNARKTHCKRNHEFTAENTYVYTAKDGSQRRTCRACADHRRLIATYPHLAAVIETRELRAA